MCGIFGYQGTGPADPDLLAAAAADAGRRGPHGCGWSIRTEQDGVRTEHHLGALTDQLQAIRDLRAPVVLGHARLATVGDWADPDQLQPITVAGYALAHNGVIRNPDDLTPGHPTDSIALAHAYAQLRTAGASPYEALDKVVAAADQHAWVIVALDVTGRLYAHRRYHPLWLYRTGPRVYLSSRRFHPEATLLAEDQALAL